MYTNYDVPEDTFAFLLFLFASGLYHVKVLGWDSKKIFDGIPGEVAAVVQVILSIATIFILGTQPGQKGLDVSAMDNYSTVNLLVILGYMALITLAHVIIVVVNKRIKKKVRHWVAILISLGVLIISIVMIITTLSGTA